MENKYYNPDISEFYIGFEYELLDTNYEYKVERLSDNKLKVLSDPVMTEYWVKKVYNDYDFLYIEDSIEAKSNLQYYVDSKKVRVKYLDKEDIENLGFIFTFQEFGGTCAIIGSNNKERDSSEFIGIQFEEDWKGILNGPMITLYNNKDRLFNGIIKNKSELIKLLKQLNINE